MHININQFDSFGLGGVMVFKKERIEVEVGEWCRRF